MAIKKSYSRFGVDFTNAYHKINSINYNINERYETSFSSSIDASGSMVRTEVTNKVVDVRSNVNVIIYGTQTERENLGEILGSRNYMFTIDLDSTDNWIVQAYEHVKAQAEYSGSADV